MVGWLRCDGQEHSNDHEGWVVAVVRDGYGWRELHLDDAPQDVTYVQVGCECGWRSPRLIAPLGTRFAPCFVDFPTRHGQRDDLYHDTAADLWSIHMDQMSADSPSELLDRARALHCGAVA